MREDPSARTNPQHFPPSHSGSLDQELGLDTLWRRLRGCSGQEERILSSSPPAGAAPYQRPSPLPSSRGKARAQTARLSLLEEVSAVIPRHACPAQDGDMRWGLLLTPQPSKPLPPPGTNPRAAAASALPPAHRGLTNSRYCLNCLSALRRSKTQSVKHQGPHTAHSPAPGEHRSSTARGLQGTKTTPHR